MSCITKIFCCFDKPKPQDSPLVRSTPITPDLKEKAFKQREAQAKIATVVNGLREGQVFPKGGQ